jgi:hypothetical protein
MVATGPGVAPVPNLGEKEVQRVEAKYQARLAEIEARQVKAEADLATARDSILSLKAELEPQLEEAKRQRTGLYELFKNPGFSKQFMIAMYALGGAMLLTALVSLVKGLRRRGRQALPYHVLAICSFLLGAATLGSQILMEDHNLRNVQGTLKELTGNDVDPSELPVILVLPPEFTADTQQKEMPKEAKPAGKKTEKEALAKGKDGTAGGQAPHSQLGAATAAPAAPAPVQAPVSGEGRGAGENGAKQAAAVADKVAVAERRGRPEAGKDVQALNWPRAAEAGQALDRALKALRTPPPDYATKAASARRGRRMGNEEGQPYGIPQAQREEQGKGREKAATSYTPLDAQRLAQVPLEQYQPFIVREYAHQRTRGSDGTRPDFPGTVYWHPALVLPDGKVTVSFELGDSATGYQVLVSGHTLDGRLGVADSAIEPRAK